MAFWKEDIETASVEELKQIQLEELQETIFRVYKQVSFYRKMFDEYGITPEDVQEITDLTKLPFTTKDDLRENYPYDMFALPLKEVVRIHSTTGTTGKPNVVGFTRNDLNRWQEVSARLLTCAGVGKEDVVQISYDYGMFNSGFGLQSGSELIGASVIPVHTHDLEKQIMVMKDYKTTVLIGTPSYFMQIIEKIEELEININTLNLRIGILGNEPWSENMRNKIESSLAIDCYDIYGLSEIMGLGVACECENKEGLHIWEDHFIAELIDPNTQQVIKDGSEGELVLTTIKKEAIPLIRYRTEDIVSIYTDKCKCGRTHKRITRILGRTNDAIIVQGRKLYPSQIEEVLLRIEHTQPHYMIILDRVDGVDTIEINVEVVQELFVDDIKQLVELKRRIENEIAKTFEVRPNIKLVEPKTLERMTGKTIRVLDKRSK